MDRLDIELYAERLARLVDRVADELADARLREAWDELERCVVGELTPADADRLRALGVLGDPAVVRMAMRAVTDCAADLAALQRLQVAVEALRAQRRQAGAGVTATNRPPSAS